MSADEKAMHYILIFVAVLFNARSAFTFSASHSFEVLLFHIPEKQSYLFQGIFIRIPCSKNELHHNSDSFDHFRMRW